MGLTITSAHSWWPCSTMFDRLKWNHKDMVHLFIAHVLPGTSPVLRTYDFDFPFDFFFTWNMIGCTEATRMINSFLGDIAVQHQQGSVFDWFLKS